MRSSLFAGVATALIAASFGGGKAFSQEDTRVKFGLGYLLGTQLGGLSGGGISGEYKATLVPSVAIGARLGNRDLDFGLAYIPARESKTTPNDKIDGQIMPSAGLALPLGSIDIALALGYLPKTKITSVRAIPIPGFSGTRVATIESKAALVPSGAIRFPMGRSEFNAGLTYIPARKCGGASITNAGISTPSTCATLAEANRVPEIKLEGQFMPSASFSISF